MRRKLHSDPWFAIPSKEMAKNGHFLWRPGDEPFFILGSTVHDWGWAKTGPFWTTNGQTWQACQLSKVVQNGLKGTNMVNLSVFDQLGPFGPIWALLDNLRQKWFFAKNGQSRCFGAKINFCLKWCKGVQMGPKESQMVKTHRLTILVPFEPFWTTLERLLGPKKACLISLPPKWSSYATL